MTLGLFFAVVAWLQMSTCPFAATMVTLATRGSGEQRNEATLRSEWVLPAYRLPREPSTTAYHGCGRTMRMLGMRFIRWGYPRCLRVGEVVARTRARGKEGKCLVRDVAHSLERLSCSS